MCSSCPKSGAGPGSRLPSSRLVGRDTRRSDQQRLKVADDSPPLTFSPPFVPSLPSARRHLFTLRFATPRSDTISSLGDSSGTFTVSHIVSPSGMALRRRLESRWNEYVNQPQQQQQQAAQPQAVDSSFFFKANSAACSHTQCPVPGQVGVFEVRSQPSGWVRALGTDYQTWTYVTVRQHANRPRLVRWVPDTRWTSMWRYRRRQ